MRRTAGFTYIGVLLLLAVMGASLAAAGEVWHTLRQREKERELLFIGHQFRLALERYARQTPRKGQRGPQRLEDLLLDPRSPGVQRYLRQIYVDPMTGRPEWGLVIAANGEINGVHSLSAEEPLKKANFAPADRPFEGTTKYSDWIFMRARN